MKVCPNCKRSHSVGCCFLPEMRGAYADCQRGKTCRGRAKVHEEVKDAVEKPRQLFKEEAEELQKRLKRLLRLLPKRQKMLSHLLLRRRKMQSRM